GVALLRRILPSIVTGAPEVSVARAELPWLAGAIGAGGVLGPLLLMFGLARTDAAAASLLLTIEGAAAALCGVVHFPRKLRSPYCIRHGKPRGRRCRTVVVRCAKL